MLNVTMLPILEDNYTYIIQSGDKIAVIDPGDATPIIDTLEQKNLTLDYIFITHHHWDHTDGASALINKYACDLYAPKKEKNKIESITKTLKHGDNFEFGDELCTVIETPGHTMGHICFHFAQSKILFSADTLFHMGCGRLFEGDANDLFLSFERLRELPDDTTVYCGHEYSLSNAKFCNHVAPESNSILKRYQEIKALRKEDTPTIPTTIAIEKQINLFFMAETAQDLKRLRDQKDKF